MSCFETANQRGEHGGGLATLNERSCAKKCEKLFIKIKGNKRGEHCLGNCMCKVRTLC